MLHGCVVSHMQVLATTLLSVHNLLNTHFAGPLQLKEFNFSKKAFKINAKIEDVGLNED